MEAPQKVAITGNRIKSQMHKYLSENPDISEKALKAKIYEQGINAKKLNRFLNNVQQPLLNEAAQLAELLECSVDDLTD